MPEGQRRLAAIMFTDMVGFTNLSQSDEAQAMQLLDQQREMVRPFFQKHGGREVKTIGDAFLVEFDSALEAVRSAFEIQQSLHEMSSSDSPRGNQILLRIGIHVGDVIHSQNDVYGDAVNVASRIEPLASPGGICLSAQVYDHIRNKFEFPLTSLGRKELKNVEEPTEVFKVVLPWEQKAPETPTLPVTRIAVLPFASFSVDPNDGFFADGITEEIISTVSGISGLSVISRTSIMGYKGTTKKVGEIGKELGVGTILEGSFRKSGNKIRVTTQLIDVVGDKHLWVQNYDRNLDDVFEVQSDVAKQIAEALRVKILRSELERINKKPTESTEAYALYLKGRSLWNKRGVKDLEQASECFEQAIKNDPGFALGYAGVADCCLLLRNNWGLNNAANLEKARAMLAKALELDPNLAEAHATMGLVLQVEYDPRGAEVEYKKAIGLKPNYATAHQWYFGLLSNLLRVDEAREQIEKALELDPLSPIINDNYGDYFSFLKGDYQKGIEHYERAAELGMVAAHDFEALAYGKLKMFPEMRRESSITAEANRGTFPLVDLGNEAFFAWMEDDKEKLRGLLPRIEANLPATGWNVYLLAMPYFHLGEKDRGFELLEKAYAEKEGYLAGIQTGDFFDSIRNDPRYLDLLKRLGFEKPPDAIPSSQ